MQLRRRRRCGRCRCDGGLAGSSVSVPSSLSSLPVSLVLSLQCILCDVRRNRSKYVGLREEGGSLRASRRRPAERRSARATARAVDVAVAMLPMPAWRGRRGQRDRQAEGLASERRRITDGHRSAVGVGQPASLWAVRGEEREDVRTINRL